MNIERTGDKGVEGDARPGNGPRETAPVTTHGIGHQFVELSQETVALIGGEVALARAEMNEKITQVEQGVAAGLSGGAILYAGLLVLLAAAVLGLALVMAAWLAALIVGGVVAVIGAISLATSRKKLSKQALKPTRMIEEAKASKAFAKEQVP